MSKVIMLLCVCCVTACGRDVAVGENDHDARTMSLPDAGAFDPCAHPDCANGGQVPFGDGAVLLCQCPKVRGDR